MTKWLFRTPARYVAKHTNADCDIDADVVFSAMMEDLLHDGDVDLALQKAFRWGFRDGEGEQVDGLRHLMQRLREDRQNLIEVPESTSPAEAAPRSDGVEAGGAGDQDGFGESDRDPGLAPESLRMVGRMEAMERSLRQVEGLDDLQGLDLELMDSVLTDAERSWIEQWEQMGGTLAAEGLVVEVGDHLELTPRAVRRIGEQALMAIFSSLRVGTGGDHDTRRRGPVGTRADTSSPWQHGDPFALDMSCTILNSIRRQGAGAPVRMAAEDFEVFDRESRTATASVLLIDMSRSMFYNGCWDAAKRSALALDTLMRGQFHRDDLELVGFSHRAERLTFAQLPSLEWNEYSHGTNLEDGLRLARELLLPHRAKNRQVILITDGEPSAFIENGSVTFENPPTTRTFDATLREVARCSREDITINTFLLEQSAALTGFIEKLARINRGRVIHAAPQHLGSYLVRDFLSQRTIAIR